MNLQRDLTNPRWMFPKAALFCGILLLSFVLILIVNPWWQRAILASLLIWSSARLYYFAFYVIEKYIDLGFRFSGLISVLHWIHQKS